MTVLTAFLLNPGLTSYIIYETFTLFVLFSLKVAHRSVQVQLLGYIYNGFLVPVMAPALHKVRHQTACPLFALCIIYYILSM